MKRHVAILLMVSTMVIALWGCNQKAETKTSSLDLSDVEFGKDFHLRDADGKTRTMQDYKGKVVMLFFGFTQCPDVCPTALSRAAAIREQLGQEADRLQVIFVTVDPERDTPSMLKSYTAAFDPSFIGLSADLATTRKTADEFHIYYAKVPTGSSYTMDHSAITYLIDPFGKLRLAVRPAATVEEVAQDVRTLLKTRSS